jgi:hypothetical protein
LLANQGRQGEGVVLYNVDVEDGYGEKGKSVIAPQPFLPICYCHSEGIRKHSLQYFLMFDLYSFTLCDFIGTQLPHKWKSTCSFMPIECSGSSVIHVPAGVSGVGL